MEFIYLTTFCLVLIGCSANNETKLPRRAQQLEHLTVYPSDTKPVHKLTFKKEVSFSSTSHHLLGKIGAIAVDQQGNVYLADKSQLTIHIFRPNGVYLGTLGKKGRGPGEFQNITAIKIRSNKLYAFDHNQMKISLFSLHPFNVLKPVVFRKQQWDKKSKGVSKMLTSAFYVFDNRQILIKFGPFGYDKKENHLHYYLINPQGNIISDEIFKQQARKYYKYTYDDGYERDFTFPFNRKSLLAVSEKNQIYSAWSEYFLIQIYKSGGKYIKAYYYPFRRSKLSRDTFLHRYDQNDAAQKALRKVELPSTWPALHDIKIDDQNRLWVSTIVPNQKVYQWWVLNADDGKLLSRFKWPRSKSIQKIQGNKLYTRETDSSGVGRIVRYGIQMN